MNETGVNGNRNNVDKNEGSNGENMGTSTGEKF